MQCYYTLTIMSTQVISTILKVAIPVKNNNNNKTYRLKNSPIRITGGNAATAVDESSNTCTDHTTAISCNQHGPAPPPIVNIVSTADIITDENTTGTTVDTATSRSFRTKIVVTGTRSRDERGPNARPHRRRRSCVCQ